MGVEVEPMGMTSVLGVPLISQSLLADLNRVGRKYTRWTRQAYLELDGNYLVEFSQGTLEILPMPTTEHHLVAQRFNLALAYFVDAGKAKGRVFFAGIRVEVADGLFREPDVLFVPEEWYHCIHKEYIERAGLVVEVLSESNRNHDLVTKRAEYAGAGIPEYWILDPEAKQVTVLKLADGHYIVHGEFREGDRANSVFLPGFDVDVAELFVA